MSHKLLIPNSSTAIYKELGHNFFSASKGTIFVCFTLKMHLIQPTPIHRNFQVC